MKIRFRSEALGRSRPLERLRARTVSKEKGTSVIEIKHSPRTPPRGAGVLTAFRAFGGRGKMGARSGPLIVTLALLCLGLFAVPAFAEQKRIFSGSFGGENSIVKNPYPLGPSDPPHISGPWSLAVDESSGDVYVADGANYRVEKFSPSGEFLLMFGKAVNKTKIEALAPEAEQNVCTEVEVELGAECQAGTAASTPGAFAGPEPIMDLAVDSSSGPSAGDVYVADYEDHLVTKFNQAGKLVESWGDNGSGESANGQLARPMGKPTENFGGWFNGIVVNANGNLWVDGTGSETQRLFEFNQDGSLITDWIAKGYLGQSPFDPLEFGGIAIDPEGNLYLPDGSYYKFDPAGILLGIVNSTKRGYARGVAIDSSDNFYVNEEEAPGTIFVYPSCHPRNVLNGGCVSSESFGSNHPADGALAVNSASPGDTLYAAERVGGQVFAFSRVTVPGVVSDPPADATLASATLEGSVNPSGIALKECFFEFGESESYGQKIACEESVGQIGSGQTAALVRASATGLQAGKTYHYRLVAINANNVNEPSVGVDVAFGPPLVLSESSLDVSATSAIAQAEVSPENVDAHVRVEYGFDTSYGLSSAGSDFGDIEQSVSVPLQGLSSESVYHYRFVVENVFGIVDGPDRMFTTGGTGEFALPDGRQWQMVSPPSKEGALIEPIGEQGVIQAAANGDAISYTTNAPTEVNPVGYVYRQQVLSTRTGFGASSAWSSRDITPPHETATGVAIGGGQEYRLFSEDLSAGIVHPYATPDHALSTEASEATPFLHSNFSGDPNRPCTNGCFRPLVSGCPEEGEVCAPSVEEHADVSAGTVFAHCVGSILCGPQFESATSDLGRVVVKSDLPLKPGAPTSAEYEWSSEGPGGEERLQLVSILPDGKASGGSLGLDAVERHPISVDGSRIFWTADGLYMRDTVKKETVQLDAAEKGCGACASGSGFQFQFASRDGSRAFFTDQRTLTQNAGKEANDLYECAIVEASDGTLECRLSDLTPLGAGGAEASVQGFALGASEDGSRLYFVANGVLGDGAEHGAVRGDCGGIRVSTNTCNLYTLHYNGSEWERPAFIATLSNADLDDWADTGATGLQNSTARVSPDGRYLAFMSQRSLTGYDNRDASSGQPDEEVYEYDVQSGWLACASCDPTGARPHGVEYSEIDEGIAGGNQLWNRTQWLAAELPNFIAYNGGLAIYQPRYLSDSGRLFFNSSDALVPKDVNGQEDVYEFEPEGVGGCASGSFSGGEVYVKQIAGALVDACVGLISSGSSAQESGLLDASENGGDVFLLTTAKLAPQDFDKAFDIYDAQECTSEAPCPPVPAEPASPCDTEASCRAAPTPQPEIFGPSGSATFSGPANPVAPVTSPPAVKQKRAAQLRAEKLARAMKACRKAHGSKGKRSVCEKRARKKYGASSARKSNHHKGSN